MCGPGDRDGGGHGDVERREERTQVNLRRNCEGPVLLFYGGGDYIRGRKGRPGFNLGGEKRKGKFWKSRPPPHCPGESWQIFSGEIGSPAP